MYITPEFGTAAWISEYCSSVGANPDLIFGLFVCMLVLVLLLLAFLLNCEQRYYRMKKFLLKKRLLQEFEEQNLKNKIRRSD